MYHGILWSTKQIPFRNVEIIQVLWYISKYHGITIWFYHCTMVLPQYFLREDKKSCSWKQTSNKQCLAKKFRACCTIFPRLPHSSFKVMASFVPPSDVMQSSWHACLLHLYSALRTWTLELLQRYCWPLCGFCHKSGRFWYSFYFLITQYAVSTGISKHNLCFCFFLIHAFVLLYFFTCLEHS